MTDKELRTLVTLQGQCSYNDSNKQTFRRLGMKLAREIREGLRHSDNSTMVARYNSGGIAVSGDVSLRQCDGARGSIYLTFNADGMGLGILYRHCSPDNLYGASTATPNHYFSFADLLTHGVQGLITVLQSFTAQRCIPNNMRCTGHELNY